MKLKRMAFLLLAIVAILPFCSAEGVETMMVSTNQAVYQPGAQVVCSVDNLPVDSTTLRFCLLQLDEIVLTRTIDSKNVYFSFNLPDKNYVGYLLVVNALNSENKTLETAMIGIDCSSSWTKFPRYGYLWDYRAITNTTKKIEELSRYHINGLQFYDWQYRHHIPVSPDLEKWEDWSGRIIYGKTIRNYLNDAHQKGMVCLAYNMIYAANQTYLTDGSGVNASWRLVKRNGQDFTIDMDASRGPVGILQYFNPLNTEWQKYIFARELEVFSAYDFDGWHGDTIGEMGIMKTANGEPLGIDEDGNPIYYVKDTYTQFLNAAKEAIGDKYLVFNPVGAQGIENVNISDVDVLYTEFWPWDNDDRGLPYADYYSIHRAILQANEQSGGKSLVVAGYINYKNPASSFNTPAVRLMDSMVFASGGSRIELGNGDGMLSNEYFPDDRNKAMDRDLQAAVQRIYDFAVAYENLLRDGQKPVKRNVQIDEIPASNNGKYDTVWVFSKADDKYEIYHFINLVGTDSDWRDTEQTKKVPEYQKDLNIRIYTDFPATEICLASPDTDDLTVHTLPFEKGTDDEGSYLSFILPGLAYWDMVFLR